MNLLWVDRENKFREISYRWLNREKKFRKIKKKNRTDREKKIPLFYLPTPTLPTLIQTYIKLPESFRELSQKTWQM